jgi:hypothetical protein
MKTEIKDLSKKWTFEEKRGFVNRMEPSSEEERNKWLMKSGVSKRKYNNWRKKYGVTVIYNPIVENLGKIDPKVLRFVNDGYKYYRNIEISVSIRTIDDIIEITNELMKLKNVLCVTCIE